MQKFNLFFSPTESINYFVYNLENVVNWSNLWQLSISNPKTFFSHIGNKNPQHNFTLEIKLLNTENDKRSGNLCNVNTHLEIAKKANIVANFILHTFRRTDSNLYVRTFDAYV